MSRRELSRVATRARHAHRTQYELTLTPPPSYILVYYTARWRRGATGKAFGLAISRSRVQILLEAALQVVYTYVPLSPSSITWYRPKGGDALRLGR